MRITCWELFECVGTYFRKAKNRIKANVNLYETHKSKILIRLDSTIPKVISLIVTL